MISVANMAMPRAASGVLPKAAINSPKVAVTRAKHKPTPRKPSMLPAICTWKNRLATRKMNNSRPKAMMAPDRVRAASTVFTVIGEASSRFHRPMRRASSTPIPASMPMNRMNCTAMPAKAWA